MSSDLEQWNLAQSLLSAAIRELEGMVARTPEEEGELVLAILMAYGVTVRNGRELSAALERAMRVIPLLENPVLKCKLAAYCYLEIPDEELLELLDIPKSMLPEVKPSTHVYGKTEYELLGGEIPISGAAGDQQCAMFGQCCFEAGQMKNTYGTGCFLLMNTGETPVESKNGLVTTIAVGYEDRVQYALEGSIFVAGAAIQWLRDQVDVLTSAKESYQYATSVSDTAGGYVVPAFTGLGAPHWNQHARGCVVGITRGFTRAHLVRATLESLAYQTHDICKAMEQDSGIPIAALKVDGGACANNFLMQFQSDILDCHVHRPQCIETTALGAAYLAGLAVGYWKSLDDIRNNWAIDSVFEPNMEAEKREDLLEGWRLAVECSKLWAKRKQD